MVHSLRKYLSNRGSALFMVVSTMTALMIACLAMYFSVMSSRQTTFATFFQHQSYQSAISLNDMVLAGLMDGSLAGGSADLLSTLNGMNVGETITTGANGFSSFDATLTGADIEQMGAYSMDITRLPNETVNGKDNMTFDIATTTINNGISETVHTYVHVEMSAEEIPNGDNIFAATGYVPNDAYLDAGYFMTDVFFDTEYTYVSLYNNASRFAGDLRTGGNLIITKQLEPLKETDKIGDIEAKGTFRPVTWGIRQNLVRQASGALKFCAGSKMLIGGDLIFGDNSGICVTNAKGENTTTGTMDVYVLGNLDLGGNTCSFNGVNLYVSGDIINGGQLKDAKNVYVGGTDSSLYKTYTPKSWNSTAPGMTYEEAKRELNRETYSKTYRKWVINGEDPSKSDYIPQLNSAAPEYNPISIKLNNGNGYVNGVDGMKTVFTIAYGDNPALHPDADVVCKAGVIEEVVGNFTGNMAPLTVVLDTGNDEDNILTLRVSGYLADDGKTDGGNVFKWFRECNTGCTVLVKGKGTVVIDIPDGVVYQDCDRQHFIHESWLTLLGCTETDGTLCPSKDANNNPCMSMSCSVCSHLREYDWTGDVQDSSGTWGSKTTHVYNSIPLQKNTALIAKKYIHSSCHADDDCTYSLVDAKDKNNHKIECTKHPGTYKKTVMCGEHGKTSMPNFCPECDKYNKEKADELVAGTHDAGVCNNRLEKTKVINSGIVLPGGILPKTDIFLVSSSESADIRLANDLNDHAIMQNGFYGFIYAPYMTFKAEGGSGLGGNRLCGGMIVSDYAINDFYAFTNLYPSKMPDDLMGESSEVMEGFTDKSWKISLGSY